MKQDFSLPAWEYEALWLKLCDKMKAIYEARNILTFPDTDLKIIGYNAGKKPNYKDPVLPDLINEEDQSESGAQYLLNPGFFYERMRVLNTARDNYDPNLPISMKEEYWKKLFKFIDCNNLEEFRSSAYKIYPYTGYYFSRAQHKVCTFAFELISLPEGLKLPFNTLAKVKGHQCLDEKAEYMGPVRNYKGSWTATLTNEDQAITISIFKQELEKNPTVLATEKPFYGVLTGASTNNYLLNHECIFYVGNNPHEQVLLGIRRYLNLRRNHFKVNIKNLDQASIKRLEMNGILFQKLDHYTKKPFRIIKLGKDDVLIQSRFTILPDFSSTINIPNVEEGPDLNCSVLWNNIHEDRVLVHAHRDETVIYSFTNFEYSHNLKNQKIILGSFSVTDTKYANDPFGSRFAMCEDDSNFEIKEFKGDEISELEKDPIAARLIEKLKE